MSMETDKLLAQAANRQNPQKYTELKAPIGMDQTKPSDVDEEEVKHQLTPKTPKENPGTFKMAASHHNDFWGQYVKQPNHQYIEHDEDVKEEEKKPKKDSKEPPLEELYFADPHAPRRIFCMMKIKRISDVETADQTFKAKFHMYFDWLLTQSEYEKYKENKKDFTPSWKPDYVFANLVEGEVDDEAKFTVKPLKDFDPKLSGFDPKKAYFCRKKIEVDGTFQETFELEKYPFDCQDLSIILKEGTGIDNAIFVPEFRTIKEEKGNGRKASAFVRFNDAISSLDEYELRNCVVEFGGSHPDDSKSKKIYSEMYVSIKLARKWSAVLMNTLLVMLLVIILTFAVFAIEFSDVADRLAYTVTLMLTAVLFAHDAKDSETPYLTIMDKYELSSYVYLTCMMIQNSLGAFSWYDEDAEMICIYVFLALFTVMHIYFIAMGILVRKMESSKLNMSYTEVNEFNHVDSKNFEFTAEDWYNTKLKGNRKWIAFRPNEHINKVLV